MIGPRGSIHLLACRRGDMSARSFAMKRIVAFLLVFLSFSVGSALAAEAPYRHVVLFKFKDNAAPAEVKKVEDAFLALEAKIPQIQDLEWGTNVSPEKHDKGFTHCWVLGFKTEKDRDEYLVHPDHKAFGKVVGASGVGDIFVVDFWAQDVKGADKGHH